MPPRAILTMPPSLPRLAPAGLGLLAVAAAALACGDATSSPAVGVETRFIMPRALLDKVTKVTLAVIEGDVTCAAAVGQTTFPNGITAAKEVARKELGTQGCLPGARFCGDLTVQKSDALRVFSATATGADDATLAIGCATAKLQQDAASVAINLVRYLAPAACNDGVIQPTEQCEPGGTAICDDACQSTEILLSTGSAANGTQTGTSGDKTNPRFLWPAQPGDAGRFFAFYTDRAISGNNVDVSLRVMRDDLAAVTSPPALAAGSIFLPNGSAFPPPPSARQQSFPDAALLNSTYFVAFQDDDTTNGLDIHVRSMDSALVAGQAVGAAIGINGPSGAGEANIQSAPAIAAGPSDRLFVAWEDAAQGKIAGRTLTPPASLGNQNDISTGNGNTNVSVAATTTGWIAVWQSGTGVKLRAINADGTPQGLEQTVNEDGLLAAHPRVASLPDGRFAVTWSAGDEVFFQRYDTKGNKISGDQATPLNDVVTDGTQSEPVIAATSAVGGSYAIAWRDETSNHVRARMIGGSSGFLFNNVNGQSSEFQASRADNRKRANPTIVSGGSGPFVAIGWEDQSTPGAGIIVRRFPLPTD